MGRVFSPLEVSEGRIPRRTNFMDAEKTFTGMADLAIAGSGLVSAQIYGSWAARTKRANVRSNFDGILVYDGTPTGFRACEEIITRTEEYSMGLVSINVASYSQTSLVHGRHEIDRFFGQRLTNGGRIVRGEDPATYINYSPEPALFILRNYLAHQKRSLTAHGMSHDDSRWVLGLQRMLEAPIAVGQKVLQVTDELRGTEFCPADSADKPSVAGRSLEIFKELEADRFPFQLLFADGYYTEALTARLDGSITQNAYVGVLNELDGMVPEAVSWIDTIDASVAPYLENALGR